MDPVSTATETTTDPFEMLMHAGSDKGIWFLIGGPVALLLLVIVVYAIVVSIRRRQERAEWATELKAASADAALDHAKEQLTSEPEDLEEATPYAIPEALHTEEVHEPEPEPPAELMASVQGPAEVEEVRQVDRAGWLHRLKTGLTKTRDALRGNLESLFTGKTKIDSGVLEKLHEALYRADIGVMTADKLVDHVRATLGKEEAADWDAVSWELKAKAKTLFEAPSAKPEVIPESGPRVILIVGVNGVGKTTSIGKLAAHFLAEDRNVLLAAGDTFRAAAIEQLSVWGDRLGVDVVKHKQGSDPAAVAYDGVKAAVARKVDVLLIDTAGRLHSKAELMDELGKINRVIGKDLAGAPHETWLVVDATTGQNAVQQVKAFNEVTKLTGLVVTKLDGTAKGGVLLGITDQFQLPIRYIGVGEKAADLRRFQASDYVDSLF
jgi:fused signal recognition particle receptor